MVAQNNIVGEVGLRVVPVDPAAQFQAGVDQIIKRLEKSAQFQIQASGIENVAQQANGIGQAFAQASIEAAGLTAAVFGIRAAVQNTIQKFSSLFDQLAQAKAGFGSILHSDALGGALLDDIREFARVSPFVTQELVNYSQQLLGVGERAKDIIPLLKSTGDILSSVGGDTTQLGRVLFTLTQIKSIGSLKGQDTLQLQNSLIPITKYLSEYLHKSSAEIVKLRENAQITADDVFNAINAQGEKVKGAMDKATRNIVGARAILSDTFTILIQNQPVLDKIFKDMYKSILSFSNFIGSSEFQDAFGRFFDGVNNVYESLKPLFASIASIGSSGAVSGLQIFGTVLNAIGSALSAIPKVGIDVIAHLLVALGSIRAPLLLFQYAQSIQRITSAVLPAVGALGKLGSAQATAGVNAQRATQIYREQALALDATTRALSANQRAALANRFAEQQPGFISRHKAGFNLAAQVGASYAGEALSSNRGIGAKTAGGALQYGAIGAAFGPEGALIGAAFGGLTAYFNEQKERVRKQQAAIVELGKQGAQDFIDAQDRAFGVAASGRKYSAYKKDIDAQQREVTQLQNTKAAQAQDLAANTLLGKGRGNTGDAKGALKATNDALLLAQTRLDLVKKSEVTEFEPLQIGLTSLLPLLNKTGAAYNLLTTPTGRGHVRVATTDINKLEEAAKTYGFALDDFSDPAKFDAITTLTNNWDGLTSATQRAIEEANKYNNLFTEAKKNADAIYNPQKTKLENESAYRIGIAKATKAQYDLSSKDAILQAKLEVFNAKALARAQTEVDYRQRGYAESTVQYAADAAAAKIESDLLDKRREGENFSGLRAKFLDANNNDPANGHTPRDINKEIVDAEALKKKNEEEAAAAAKKAAEEAAAYADKVKSATASLSDKLQSAADAIAAAAERWVGSIKERTQYEKAVSAGTAIKNTERQIKDLAELTAGINELRARGLTDDAIKALGIDNVNDVKQVRKLLKANPGDIAKLSGDVAALNSSAVDIATTTENKRTQDNIRDGILAAANTLGIDLTKPNAAAIASTFNITTGSNADEVAQAILFALSGGKIGR